MSVSVDLKMRMMLDAHLNSVGTEDTNTGDRVIDLTPLGIAGISEAICEVQGEHSFVEERDANKVWIEGALVKNPQSIITPSEKGLSHKKNMYVVFVKTPKDRGLYFNEAVSALIEAHFPNNKHIRQDGNTVTILKTYQQPTIYLMSDDGRFQNRIFIESEIYFLNN